MSTKINLQKIKKFTTSMLFPEKCLICGSWLLENEEGVCELCQKELAGYRKFISCEICGRTVHPKLTPICPDCLADRPNFVFNRSAVEYNRGALELVHSIKYKSFYKGAEVVGSVMDSYLPKYDDIIVVPVPLSRRRFKERGFNQAEEIAKKFATLRGLGMELVLERTRNTVAQASLNRARRKLNVKGAFRVKKGYYVKGRQFLIIDDVFTTGSTVGECALELVKAGAKNVLVATFMAA